MLNPGAAESRSKILEEKGRVLVLLSLVRIPNDGAQGFIGSGMGEVGPIRKGQKHQGKEFNLGPITFLKIRVGEHNEKSVLE